MGGPLVWLGLICLLLVLYAAIRKYTYSGKLGTSMTELKALVHQFHQGSSSASDLERWESSLKQLENHPNEYNKLNYDINMISTFTQFLERYYPEDDRLVALRKINATEKDSIWGIKIGRTSPKE